MAGLNGKRIESMVASTQNSEYHLVDGRVFRVFCKSSGRWQLSHRLIGQQLRGSWTYNPFRRVKEFSLRPRVGGQLWFEVAGRCILTSPVLMLHAPQLKPGRFQRSRRRRAMITATSPRHLLRGQGLR